MKIEKVNNNKIKIMFDSDELEENNISVHSFLANSSDAQKLFLAILDIADEEFGFNAKNCKINYETISFDNKKFVIIITKAIYNSENTTSPYNLLEICKQNPNFCHTENVTKVDFPIYNIENDTEILLYRFDDMEELCSFCSYLNTIIPNMNFENSLYQYENIFFLEINLQKISPLEKSKITSIISEYKDSIILSELGILKFNENSNLVIKNNAIKSLKK